MIIVTGANGQLGRQVVEHLVTRVPATEVGVSVREPDKAHALRDLGVRVRAGSFTDAASLAHAFEGVTQLLLVSSNTVAGDTLAQHRTAIDAAVAAGARRIVYTSHMAASASSQFPPMRNHAATEELLASSGVAWTSLRNGFYAASALLFFSDPDKVAAPADGPVAWTAHADLAEAAAIVLSTPGRFEGPTPSLTGSAALDLADLAKLRGLPRVIVPDDEFRAGLAARGAPPARIDITMGLFLASRAGEFSAVDPTLAQLIGRAPITMRSVIA